MTPLQAVIRAYVEEEDCDLFLYRGDLTPGNAETFVRLILSQNSHRDNASLLLSTLGGDAHSAYRMARCLRKNYKKIRLLIVGPCKSAGTLIAVGSDELAFGPSGELGPLDVQLAKQDDLIFNSSGLDTFQR